MSKFTARFSEVILYVKDMAVEVHFYHNLLGLPIRYPENKTDFSNEMWVEFETGSCTLALHGSRAEKPDDKHELVFTVENIQNAWKALLDAGIELGEIRTLETGAPIASGFDPDGHSFSIRE